MAAAPGPGPQAGAGPGEAGAVRRDPRVRCCSRRGLGAVLELCAPFVRALAQGQPGGAAAEAEALWVSGERERPVPTQGPAGPAGSARHPG